MYRIVIIGGGFAGAACALHLLRDHPGLAARLTIIEPRETLGAGLAYSTPASEHRTNVAAARMSVFPETPSHFHDWVRAQNTPAADPASEMPDGRLYPSRAVFGRYVAAMLQAEIAAHRGITVHHHRALARAVTQTGPTFQIAAGDNGPITADALVLAVSHTAPDLPAPLRGLQSLIADPWNTAALAAIPSQARILIVGTGLTACDVAATLLAQGHTGRIIALSRHGLLPRPRTLLPVEAEGDFATNPEKSALALLRRVRRAAAIAQAAGRPWENIIDALRQQAPSAWGALDWPERRRLLRHLRTVWDVHRFQSAPQIDAALHAARTAGALTIKAATIIAATQSGQTIDLLIRPRAAPHTTENLQVDLVINCTGPGHRSVVATHPVLQSLAAVGALQPDPAALGILVDAKSRAIRTDGTPTPNLFVAGPLARGTFGELMGLPQVNTQPRDVAAALARLASDNLFNNFSKVGSKDVLF